MLVLAKNGVQKIDDIAEQVLQSAEAMANNLPIFFILFSMVMYSFYLYIK